MARRLAPALPVVEPIVPVLIRRRSMARCGCSSPSTTGCVGTPAVQSPYWRPIRVYCSAAICQRPARCRQTSMNRNSPLRSCGRPPSASLALPRMLAWTCNNCHGGGEHPNPQGVQSVRVESNRA
jgi:hypothetical protein